MVSARGGGLKRMSLAEPKKKQRIVADPNNKKWSEGIL
jgi:hypothetical protein